MGNEYPDLSRWCSFPSCWTEYWSTENSLLEVVYLQRHLQEDLCNAGVNICPKKSETVYPEIWGILKLSGLINQKIFETVYQNFQTVSKACALILLWTGIKRNYCTRWGIYLSLSKKCLFNIFFDWKCDFSAYFSKSVWSKIVCNK